SSQGVGIGGQSGSQAAFLLDGADNNNQQISTGHSGQKEVIKPSVDAIQEFKVVTNGYSAEYGRSSSGVVSVALKSGTNQFHGAAYEFLRNEALDARNFFAATKSPYKRNQFGAALGGPVIRNKTFFFADFEISRIRQSSTTTVTVPTLAQRQGIFGSTQLAPAQIDPISAKVLSYFPLPTNDKATQNFVYGAPQVSDPHRWDFRIDHTISDRQNVYFRYSKQQADDGPGYGATNALPKDAQGNYYQGSGAQTSDSKGFVFVHNKVWSPTIVTSVHAGWNYIYWVNSIPDQKLRGLGIPGVDETNPGFSQIAITGFPTLGVSNIPNSDGSQNRQLSADLTWNKGAHNLKFGLQESWLQINFYSSQRASGIFNFNGQYSGNALQDFLQGYVSSSSVSKWSYLRMRTPYTHLFVQDDWKVSRNLTLNIGLRYELSPPALQTNDTIANFDLDTTPGSPRLVLAGQEGRDRASRALQGVDYLNFAPRFGFAYSLPDNKTVFRGGYGLFFSNIVTEGGMSSLQTNPPNNIRVSLTKDRNAAPNLLLKNGFASDALSFANAKDVTMISWDRSSNLPLAQQWNLNIQRQLPGGIVAEIGYFGNKFDHMRRSLDGNPAAPVAGVINNNRLYRTTTIPNTPYAITLADVTRIQKDGYSRFHALQAKLEKRYAKGLTLIASYQWSKSIGLGDTSGVQDQKNWQFDRAVTAQDMVQHFVGSAVYQLPFGKGRAHGSGWGPVTEALLGGWSVGPSLTLTAGMPVNLTVNGVPSNTGGADRPNVVGEWRLENPTPQRWFNTAAFVRNAAFTYGNAGRNVLRGPGLFNLDLSANKTFRLTERVSAQLRLESFNATNTPAFASPNAQVGNALFGQVSNTVGTPRDNQIGLKVIF
ncbi:MAG: hypothetical protein ABL967_19800, partial [Bryobacteraceae bacterium]